MCFQHINTWVFLRQQNSDTSSIYKLVTLYGLFLEKLIVIQTFKNLPAFYANRRFSTIFASATGSYSQQVEFTLVSTIYFTKVNFNNIFLITLELKISGKKLSWYNDYTYNQNILPEHARMADENHGKSRVRISQHDWKFGRNSNGASPEYKSRGLPLHQPTGCILRVSFDRLYTRKKIIQCTLRGGW